MAVPVLLLPHGGLRNLSSTDAIDAAWRLSPPHSAVAGQQNALADEEFEAAETCLRAGQSAPDKVDAARAFHEGGRALRAAENASNQVQDMLSFANCAQRIQTVSQMVAATLRSCYIAQSTLPTAKLKSVLENVSFMSMGDAHVSPTGIASLETAYATWHTLDAANQVQLATLILAAVCPSCCQLQPQSLAWPESGGRVATLLDDTVCGLLMLMAEAETLSTLQRTSSIQCLCRLVLARGKPSKIARLISILARATTGVADAKLHGNASHATLWSAIATAFMETGQLGDTMKSHSNCVSDPLASSSPARMLPSKAAVPRVSHPNPSAAPAVTTTERPTSSWSGSDEMPAEPAHNAISGMPVSTVPFPQQSAQSGVPQVNASSIARLRLRSRSALATSAPASVDHAMFVKARSHALLGGGQGSAAGDATSSRSDRTAPTERASAQPKRIGTMSETTAEQKCLIEFFEASRVLAAACTSFLPQAQAESVLAQVPAALDRMARNQPPQGPYRYADWIAACICEHSQLLLDLQVDSGMVSGVPVVPAVLKAAAASRKVRTDTEDMDSAGAHAFALPLAWGDLLDSLQSDLAVPNYQHNDKSWLWAAGQNTFNELCQSQSDFVQQAADIDLSYLDNLDIVSAAAGNEHTLLLTRMGQVLTVGYNAHGSCGTGTTDKQTVLQPVNIPLEHDKPREVFTSNGCEHSFVLTTNGSVLACGNNKSGQLGLGQIDAAGDDDSALKSVPLFRPIPAFNQVKVSTIGMSYNHSVFATNQGLFACGKASCFGAAHEYGKVAREPVRLRFPAIDQLMSSGSRHDSVKPSIPSIKSIACGQEHTVLLLTDGGVWTAGCNQYGQLGNSPEDPSRAHIASQGFLRADSGAMAKPSCKITMVACGYFHTLALSSSGHVFVFGRNDHGQLGLGEGAPACFIPQELALPSSDAVALTIAAGCYHSLVATQSNNLYGFGRNQHGQLFLPASDDVFSPTVCAIKRPGLIAHLSAGFYHSLALFHGHKTAVECHVFRAIKSLETSTLFQRGSPDTFLAGAASSTRPGKHASRARKHVERVRRSSKGVLLQVQSFDRAILPAGSALATVADFLNVLAVSSSQSSEISASGPNCSELPQKQALAAPGTIHVSASLAGDWPVGATASCVAALLTCASVNSKRFWMDGVSVSTPPKFAFTESGRLGRIGNTDTCANSNPTPDGSNFSDVLSMQYREFCSHKVQHCSAAANIALGILSAAPFNEGLLGLVQQLSSAITPADTTEYSSGNLVLVAHALHCVDTNTAWEWLSGILQQGLSELVVDSVLSSTGTWKLPEGPVLSNSLSHIAAAGCSGVSSAWSLLARIVCAATEASSARIEQGLCEMIDSQTSGTGLFVYQVVDLCLLYLSSRLTTAASLCSTLLKSDLTCSRDDCRQVELMKVTALIDLAGGSLAAFCSSPSDGTHSEPLAIDMQAWTLLDKRTFVEALLGSSTQVAAVASVLSPGLLPPEIRPRSLLDSFSRMWEQLFTQEFGTNILFRVVVQRSDVDMNACEPSSVSEEALMEPNQFLVVYDPSVGFRPEAIAQMCSRWYVHADGSSTCYGFSNLQDALNCVIKSLFLVEILEAGKLPATLKFMTSNGRDKQSFADVQRAFKNACALGLSAWRSWPTAADGAQLRNICILSRCCWARSLHRIVINRLLSAARPQARSSSSRWGAVRSALSFCSRLKRATALPRTTMQAPRSASLQTISDTLKSLSVCVGLSLMPQEGAARPVADSLNEFTASLTRQLQTASFPQDSNASLSGYSTADLVAIVQRSSKHMPIGQNGSLSVLLLRFKTIVAISNQHDLFVMNCAASVVLTLVPTMKFCVKSLVILSQLLEVITLCIVRRAPSQLPRPLFAAAFALLDYFQDEDDKIDGNIVRHANYSVVLFGLSLVRMADAVARADVLLFAQHASKMLAAAHDIPEGQTEMQLLQHFGTTIPQVDLRDRLETTSDTGQATLQCLCEARFHLAGALMQAEGVPCPLQAPELHAESPILASWRKRFWLYPTADANGKAKIILQRGSSAAFSCPVILARPDGAIEVAMATDRDPHQAAREWQMCFEWLHTAAGQRSEDTALGADVLSGRKDELSWTTLVSPTKLLLHRWHLLDIELVPNLEESRTKMRLTVNGGPPLECTAPGLPRPEWTAAAMSWQAPEPPVQFGASSDSRFVLPDQLLLPTGGMEEPGVELAACWSQHLPYSSSSICPDVPCSFDRQTNVISVNRAVGFDGQVRLYSQSDAKSAEASLFPDQQSWVWTHSAALVLGAEMFQKTSKLQVSDVEQLATSLCSSSATRFLGSNHILLRLLLSVATACGEPYTLLSACGAADQNAQSPSNQVQWYAGWLFQALGVVATLNMKFVRGLYGDAENPTFAELFSSSLGVFASVAGELTHVAEAVPTARHIYGFLKHMLGTEADQISAHSVCLSLQAELQNHVQRLLSGEPWSSHMIDIFEQQLGKLPYDSITLEGELSDISSLGGVGIGAAARGGASHKNTALAAELITQAHAVRVFMACCFACHESLHPGSLASLPTPEFDTLGSVISGETVLPAQSQSPRTATVIRQCHCHEVVLLHIAETRGIGVEYSTDVGPSVKFACTTVKSPNCDIPAQNGAQQLFAAVNHHQHLKRGSCTCPLGLAITARGKEVDCVLPLRQHNNDRLLRSPSAPLWFPKSSLKATAPMPLKVLSPDQIQRIVHALQTRCTPQPSPMSTENNAGSLRIAAAMALQWVRNEALYICKYHHPYSNSRSLGDVSAARMRISSPVFLESAEVQLHARALRLRYTQLVTSKSYVNSFYMVASTRTTALSDLRIRGCCSHILQAARNLRTIDKRPDAAGDEAGHDSILAHDYSSGELSQASLLMAVLGFAQSELASLPQRHDLQTLLEMGFQLHWCLVASRICHHDLTLSTTWLLDNSPFLHAVQEQLDADATAGGNGDQSEDDEFDVADSENDSDSDDYYGEKEEVVESADSASSMQSSDDEDQFGDNQPAAPGTDDMWRLAQEAASSSGVDQCSSGDPLGNLLRALEVLGNDTRPEPGEFQTPPRQPRVSNAPMSPFSPASLVSNSSIEDARSDYGHFAFDATGNLVAVSSPSQRTVSSEVAGSAFSPSARAATEDLAFVNDGCIRIHIPQRIDAISLVHLVRAVRAAASADAQSIEESWRPSTTDAAAQPASQREAELSHATQLAEQTSGPASNAETVRHSTSVASGSCGAAAEVLLQPPPGAPSAPEYSPDANTDYSAAGSALDVVRRRRNSPLRGDFHGMAQLASRPPAELLNREQAIPATQGTAALRTGSADGFLRSIQSDIDELLPRITNARDQLASLLASPRHSILGKFKLSAATDIAIEINLKSERVRLMIPFGDRGMELSRPHVPVQLHTPENNLVPDTDAVDNGVWRLALQHSLGAVYAGVSHTSAGSLWSEPNTLADALRARTWGTSCAEESIQAASGLVYDCNGPKKNFSCNLTASHVLDEDHFPSDRLQALVPSMESSQYFKSGRNNGGWDAFGQRLFDQAFISALDGTLVGEIAPSELPWVPPLKPTTQVPSARANGSVALNSIRRSHELSMAQHLQLAFTLSSFRPLADGGDLHAAEATHLPASQVHTLLQAIEKDAEAHAEMGVSQSTPIFVGMGTMEDAEGPFALQLAGISTAEWITLRTRPAQPLETDWLPQMMARTKLYLARMADLLALPAEDLAYFDLHAAVGATEGMLTVLNSRDLLASSQFSGQDGVHTNSKHTSLEFWALLKMLLFRANGHSIAGPADASLTPAALLRGHKRGGASELSSPATWLAQTHLLHKDTFGQYIFASLHDGKGGNVFNMQLGCELVCGALLELHVASSDSASRNLPFGRRIQSSSDNQACKFGHVELADWALFTAESAFDSWLLANLHNLPVHELIEVCANTSTPSADDLALTSPVQLFCGSWLAQQLIGLLCTSNMTLRFLALRKLDKLCARVRRILQHCLQSIETDTPGPGLQPHFERLGNFMQEIDLVPFCTRQLRIRLTTEPWEGRMYFSPVVHATLSLLNEQRRMHSVMASVMSAVQGPSRSFDSSPLSALEIFDTSCSSVSLCQPEEMPGTFIQVQVRRLIGNPAGSGVYPTVSINSNEHNPGSIWQSQSEPASALLSTGDFISEADARLVLENLHCECFVPDPCHVAAVCGKKGVIGSSSLDNALAVALLNIAANTSGPWKAAISDIFGMINNLPRAVTCYTHAVRATMHASSSACWKLAEVQLLQRLLRRIPCFDNVQKLQSADPSFVALWCAARVLGAAASVIRALVWGFPLCLDSAIDFSCATAAGTSDGSDKAALQCVWAIEQFLGSFDRKLREADPALFAAIPQGGVAQTEALQGPGVPLTEFLHEQTLWRSVAVTDGDFLHLHRLAASTTYLMRARKVHLEHGVLAASEWSSPQAFRTAAPPGFTWDVQPTLKPRPLLLQSATAGSSIAGSVTVSQDGLSVSHVASESWSMVNATVGFSSGVNRWSIRIDRTPTAYLFIGVARISANPQVFLGGDEHGWGFLGDRALYHDRNKSRTYGRRFGVHDVVGCELNCDEGTLSFSLNGSPLGIAFRNLTGVLYPAVSFYNHGQKITLVQQPAVDLVEQPEGVQVSRGIAGYAVGSSPPPVQVSMQMLSAPHVFAMHCPGASPSAHTLGTPVGNVRQQLLTHVAEALATMNGRSILPDAFIQMTLAARSAGDLFLEGDLARCATSSGFDILLNASRKALHPFGVKACDKIMCKMGECLVLGVRDGRLWVKPVDDSQAAWYLTQHQVAASIGVTPDVLAWAVKQPFPQDDMTITFDRLAAEARCVPHWEALAQTPHTAGASRTQDGGRAQSAADSLPNHGGALSGLVPPPIVRREAAASLQPVTVELGPADNVRSSAEAEAAWASDADRRSDCGIILLQPSETGTSAQALARVPAETFMVLNGVGRGCGNASYSMAVIPHVVKYWAHSGFDSELIEILMLAAGAQGSDNLFKLDRSSLLDALADSKITAAAMRHMGHLNAIISRLKPVDCSFDLQLVSQTLQAASAIEVCISRVLFLFHLNDVLTPCMPVFNMRARYSWHGKLGQEIAQPASGHNALPSITRALAWSAAGELTALRDLGQSDPFQIIQHCRQIKDKIFPRIKQQVLSTVVGRTNLIPLRSDDEFEHPPELPRLVIDRPGAVRAVQSQDPDQRLLGSVFGQLMRSLAWVPTAYMRLGYSHPMDDNQQRAFYVSFLGEGVDDYGGAYREVFTQATAELQATCPESDTAALPVLQPSPNAVSRLGSNRGWFVAATGTACAQPLYPGSDFHLPRLLLSPLQKSACRFVGNLFGMAIRCRILLDMQLAGSTWRLLANDPVCKESIPQVVLDELDALPEVQLHGGAPVWLLSMTELRAVDHSCASLLDQLLRTHKQSIEAGADLDQEVTSIPDLVFTTYLSGGLQVPLVHGGASRGVTLRDIPKLVLFTLAARALEGQEAINAIRQGLVDVISDAFLPLLTGPELRDTLCGAEDFDVELLKRNTEYEEGLNASDGHIQFLWQALQSMTAAERAAFLRFVWARARLPPTDASFTQKFKLQKLEPSDIDALTDDAEIQQKRDALLPKSSTCFGALYFPRYSSVDVALARLTYAAKNCISMDADFLTGQDEAGNW